MVNIQAYLQALITALRRAYGERLVYVGLQGSYLRGEAGEDSDNARRLLAIANQGQPRLYCKHDGSLDDGFELVTHPMS